MTHTISEHFASHLAVVSALEASSADIEAGAALCVTCLENGGKLLLCGNGGSAGDAQHIAAELVGRFVRDRRALAALALTTDTSALTAIANDYSYEAVFARQIEGLARPGDVLVAISTSGNSGNVLAAAQTARSLGCRVIGLTGEGGGALAEQSDVMIRVPSTVTARIQEGHILIGHILCDLIEQRLGLA